MITFQKIPADTWLARIGDVHYKYTDDYTATAHFTDQGDGTAVAWAVAGKAGPSNLFLAISEFEKFTGLRVTHWERVKNGVLVRRIYRRPKAEK